MAQTWYNAHNKRRVSFRLYPPIPPFALKRICKANTPMDCSSIELTWIKMRYTILVKLKNAA